MDFEIIAPVINIEVIAAGNSIREIKRLRKVYGSGRWRKMKGITSIQLANQVVCSVEIHWYEATGIGKREYKIKRILEEQQ